MSYLQPSKVGNWNLNILIWWVPCRFACITFSAHGSRMGVVKGACSKATRAYQTGTKPEPAIVCLDPHRYSRVTRRVSITTKCGLRRPRDTIHQRHSKDTASKALQDDDTQPYPEQSNLKIRRPSRLGQTQRLPFTSSRNATTGLVHRAAKNQSEKAVMSPHGMARIKPTCVQCS